MRTIGLVLAAVVVSGGAAHADAIRASHGGHALTLPLPDTWKVKDASTGEYATGDGARVSIVASDHDVAKGTLRLSPAGNGAPFALGWMLGFPEENTLKIAQSNVAGTANGFPLASDLLAGTIDKVDMVGLVVDGDAGPFELRIELACRYDVADKAISELAQVLGGLTVDGQAGPWPYAAASRLPALYTGGTRIEGAFNCGGASWWIFDKRGYALDYLPEGDTIDLDDAAAKSAANDSYQEIYAYRIKGKRLEVRDRQGKALTYKYKKSGKNKLKLESTTCTRTPLDYDGVALEGRWQYQPVPDDSIARYDFDGAAVHYRYEYPDDIDEETPLDPKSRREGTWALSGHRLAITWSDGTVETHDFWTPTTGASKKPKLFWLDSDDFHAVAR